MSPVITEDDLDNVNTPSTGRDCGLDTQTGTVHIRCKRDLEDYARLHIYLKGVEEGSLETGLMGTQLGFFSYATSLIYFADSSGPQIYLFRAAEQNGGMKYLTDESVAQSQVDDFGTAITVGASNDYQTDYRPVSDIALFLPSSLWEGWSNQTIKKYLLFDGASAGNISGLQSRVVMRSEDSIGIFTSPPVYMELKEITDMYERWSAGNDPQQEPSSTAQRLGFQYAASSPEESKYILFVHGWNLEQWEKERYAETVFKRLWWQGYKGRFGLFEWPTTYGFDPDNSWWQLATQSANFDKGEHNAWKSGIPLLNLMYQLYTQNDSKLYVYAHSMGNIVVGEALRLQSDAGGGNVATAYIASQAALTAHAYNSSLSENLNWFYKPGGITNIPFYWGPTTPNIYSDWCRGARNVLSTGRVVNFYNPNDYALAPDVWQLNQLKKPDVFDWDNSNYWYLYEGNPHQPTRHDGFAKKTKQQVLSDAQLQLIQYYFPSYNPKPAYTLQRLELGDRALKRDRYEIMAFAAEARCKALGASSGVEGGIAEEKDIRRYWGADSMHAEENRRFSDHAWHSGQFRFNIARQWDYWAAVLGSAGFQIQ